MSPTSPTLALVEERLGRSLAVYLGARRSEGLGWRRIADQVHQDTGVSVSHETLRIWFASHAARSARTAGAA